VIVVFVDSEFVEVVLRANDSSCWSFVLHMFRQGGVLALMIRVHSDTNTSKDKKLFHLGVYTNERSYFERSFNSFGRLLAVT
jgi:hypothetical protein